MNYLKLTWVLKRYLWVILLLIAVVPILSSSIQEAKETGNWSVIPINLGKGLVTVDSTIYNKIEEKNYEFEKFKDVEESINKTWAFFWDLFSELWKYIAIYGVIIFGLIKWIKFIVNDNRWGKGLKGVIGGGFILGVFFIIGGGTPFKGLVCLLKTFWDFFSCFMF